MTLQRRQMPATLAVNRAGLGCFMYRKHFAHALLYYAMNNHLRFRFRSNLTIVTCDEPLVPFDADDQMNVTEEDTAEVDDEAPSEGERVQIELEIHDLGTSDEYFRRLSSIARNTDPMASTLVAYFGQSYLFHDHVITRIELSPDGRSVSLVMSGCTIDNARGQMTSEGNGLTFTFMFHDVVYFANDVFHRFENAWIIERRARRPRWFQYSEVDTLDELIQKATERYAKTPGYLFEHIKEDFGITDFHSLLIQHGSPDGMLGIVFRGVDVDVSEPLAWRMLQRDPAFSIPLLTSEELRKIVGDAAPTSEPG